MIRVWREVPTPEINRAALSPPPPTAASNSYKVDLSASYKTLVEQNARTRRACHEAYRAGLAAFATAVTLVANAAPVMARVRGDSC